VSVNGSIMGQMTQHRLAYVFWCACVPKWLWWRYKFSVCSEQCVIRETAKRYWQSADLKLLFANYSVFPRDSATKFAKKQGVRLCAQGVPLTFLLVRAW